MARAKSSVCMHPVLAFWQKLQCFVGWKLCSHMMEYKEEGRKESCQQQQIKKLKHTHILFFVFFCLFLYTYIFGCVKREKSIATLFWCFFLMVLKLQSVCIFIVFQLQLWLSISKVTFHIAVYDWTCFWKFTEDPPPPKKKTYFKDNRLVSLLHNEGMYYSCVCAQPNFFCGWILFLLFFFFLSWNMSVVYSQKKISPEKDL